MVDVLHEKHSTIPGARYMLSFTCGLHESTGSTLTFRDGPPLTRPSAVDESHACSRAGVHDLKKKMYSEQAKLRECGTYTVLILVLLHGTRWRRGVLSIFCVKIYAPGIIFQL